MKYQKKDFKKEKVKKDEELIKKQKNINKKIVNQVYF